MPESEEARQARRAVRLAAERRQANAELAKDLAAMLGGIAGVVLVLFVCAMIAPVFL